MEKVSVIVPLYNVEKYMKKSIESIRNQTYSNLEIILVNDGSPDKCGQLADNYARLDTRIRVIHKENGGLSSARNAGLQKVTGDYLLFVDSDDWIEPNMIEEMLERYKQNEIDLVICNYNKVFQQYKENNYLNFNEEIVSINQIGLDNYIYRYAFNYKHGDEVWNKLYKTDIIQKNNLRFELNYDVFSEDKIFNLYYLTHVRKISTINTSYYNYLQREGSLMQKSKPRIVEQYANLTLKYISYLEKNQCNLEKIYPIVAFHLLNSSLSNFSRSDASVNQIKEVLINNQKGHISNLIKKLITCAEVRKYCKENEKVFIRPILVRGYALLYTIRANILLSRIVKIISK